MAKIDTNYQMRNGESADAYNTRVAEYNASKPDGSPAPTQTEDPIISALQKKLMSAADVVSSNASNIETKISEAIKASESSTKSGSEYIKSQFGRELGYNTDKAKNNFQTFSESQSGFATQMVAFRNLVQTTDKEQKDLIQRRDELLMQNDATGAARTSELIMKGLEFKQKAGQDMFSNILAAGSFGLQISAEQRAGREFAANFGLQQEKLALDKDIATKNQQAQMASIAAEYGVELKDGDTIADVVTRVAPMASSLKRAELNRILSETSKINKDFENKQLKVNVQSRVADLMAQNPGMTVSEATLQTMADLKSTGLEVTPDIYNFAEESAREIKKEIDAQTAKNTAETAPTYWDSVFRGIASDESFGGASTMAAKIITSPKSAFDAWKGLVGF